MLDYKEIGSRIRKHRKALRLSQEQLAEKIYISTTHMSHIETGGTKLSLPVLADISQVLGVSTDELLFGNSDSSNSDDELNTLLRSCNTTQTAIITDIIRTVKHSLDKYIS